MDIQINIKGMFFILLAMLCLVLPIDWLFAAFTAALCHEAGHILAVLLSGEKIEAVSIGLYGTVIKAAPMQQWKRIFCILSGPAASYALLALAEYIPKTSLCGFVQGTFNLLPIEQLDGGRFLRCIIDNFFSEKKTEAICRTVEKMMLLFLSIIILLFSRTFDDGLITGILILGFLFRTGMRKKSCKQ